MPCDETTSLLSVAEFRPPRMPGAARRLSGKSEAVSWWLGLPPVVYVSSGFGMCLSPGLTWLRERGSAPARKWQLAQACTPSLPTCMSQKSALPRAIAMSGSRTKSPRFEGPGTAAARRSPGSSLRSAASGGSGTRGIVVSAAVCAAANTPARAMEAAARLSPAYSLGFMAVFPDSYVQLTLLAQRPYPDKRRIGPESIMGIDESPRPVRMKDEPSS